MPNEFFESYGAHIEFSSPDEGLLAAGIARVRSSLLGNLRPIPAGKNDVVFEIKKVGRKYLLKRNGDELTWGESRKSFLKYFEAVVRLSVAEFSPELVFLHAGVVGWQGKGIVLPADSYQGKSTLVSELVRLGAEYYSDDFAIADARGHVHPFPRAISMRARDASGTPYELHPSSMGAVIGDRPIQIGMVFLTKYRPHARWRPRVLSLGEGVLQTVPFTLPINRAPERSLQVLNRIARNAIIATSDRGDARRTARLLLDFFDSRGK